MSSLLLLHFLFFCFGACLYEPQGIQVDLIFPEDNGVYKPVYPFPIIYAAKNLSAIAARDINLWWSLKMVEPAPYTGHPGVEAYGGVYQVAPYPDEFLLLNSSDQILNSTVGTLELTYGIGVKYDCYNNITRPDYVREYDHLGTTRFKLRLDGKVPDILVAGPYSKPLVSLGYGGDSINSTGGVCHSFASPLPVQSNLFKIDAALASRVSSVMMATVSCTAGSWPDNLTELPTKSPYICPRKRTEIGVSVGRETIGAMCVTFLAVMVGFVRVLLF
ncbi:uncharacterized protein GIQ15_06900 [Arthroderma uncinatum]|uniref:uncharacterized protein n=1 Tax=Arthroderma uncinatum TaxID=74035 RepID=UPI00144AE41C|nr:uncharacterized protein GIQ15_06900 [Arthroderma uncinatum]KAF3479924.1 hypothetical protein GIQ15_06900 [Arthroderma uncinatum]